MSPPLSRVPFFHKLQWSLLPMSRPIHTAPDTDTVPVTELVQMIFAGPDPTPFASSVVWQTTSPVCQSWTIPTDAELLNMEGKFMLPVAKRAHAGCGLVKSPE